ncbi:MAG: c-type cytochrome domain-containing protein, partial [Opitutales bacterium]
MRMPSKSFLFALAAALPTSAFAKIDFTRDIRPILSETCFKCHGPDKKKRKAKLRLDLSAGAVADLGGYQAIVPGKPGESELVARITTKDEDDRMPPQKSGKKLKPEQIEILKQWIAEGGKYEMHWAYRPIEKAVPPKVDKTNFVRNEIDRFVFAGTQAAGFKPSPAADPTTLVRRLYLELPLGEVREQIGDPVLNVGHRGPDEEIGEAVTVEVPTARHIASNAVSEGLPEEVLGVCVGQIDLSDH